VQAERLSKMPTSGGALAKVQELRQNLKWVAARRQKQARSSRTFTD
jgi:hypothetical protein